MTIDPATLGDLMVYAHRYVLGRMNYMRQHWMRHARKHWADLPDSDRTAIIRDTRRALDDGRAGMGVNADDWRDFLEWAEGQE